jgi:uncharacterized small protein (DUF1192 family)
MAEGFDMNHVPFAAGMNLYLKIYSVVELDISILREMREHRAQTTYERLQREPCSFCSRNELVADLKIYSVVELDISILNNVVASLRAHYAQPKIQSHCIYNGQYQACSICYRCIKGKKVLQNSSIQLGQWVLDRICARGACNSDLC